ncbi:hypothetical protein HK405_001082, partial [Cladochytrium tenue]
IYVQDTRSSSGTFVNGHRLAPQGQESPRVELRPGDTVQLGEDCELNGVQHRSVVLQLRTAGPPSSAPLASARSSSGADLLASGAPDDFHNTVLAHPYVRAQVEAEVEAVWASLTAGLAVLLTPPTA